MKLRPVQGKALEEIHDFGGLLAPIRCGAGKTLLSFLAPVVCGAARPLLMVPAKLKNKTLVEFAELGKHWLHHPKMQILSYEKVSRDGGFELLEKINPDLIIADEAHRLAHTTAGVTRKMRRWHHEHPETRWVFMSGTITTRSLRDYAHLSSWALGKLSPLPTRGNEVADWGDCLDEKVDPMRRLKPGALLGLCSDEELGAVATAPDKATEIARQAFRRRLVETPSVVATEERALGVSLMLNHIDLDISAECADDFQRLREDWETPDGWPFSEAVDLWRHARELSQGFFMRWDPRPPEEWMEARRNWSSFVRQILSSRRKGIDTEFQAAKACKAGQIDATAYNAWHAIRDTFKPNAVPVWRHQKTLDLSAKWLEKERGICWVENVAFGQALAQRGFPYFGEGGTDRKSGLQIEQASGPIVASIQSNSEGRNLQAYNRGLVVSAPPNGKIWEQLLARLHREGQQAEEVQFDILFCCREQWAGFRQAERDAKYVQDTTGAPQKILYADKDLPTEESIRALIRSGNPLWMEVS